MSDDDDDDRRKRAMGRGKGSLPISPLGKGKRLELYLRPEDLEQLERVPAVGHSARVRWLLNACDDCGLLLD
jgi:hypothetical protein